MTTTLRKVVLVGASGTVGTPILSALLEQSDEFDITILIRPTSTSTFTGIDSKINVVKAEHSLADLTNIFKGQDAVVHAAGIASLEGQKLMIEAAVQSGVKRFILNEYANSPVTYTGLPELEPFRTTKREVMDMAERLAEESNNAFTWSALATGNFIDYSLRKYPQIGIDIVKRKARLVDGGLERMTAVTLDDIGIAIRGMLRQPAETMNRVCHIRSVELSQKDMLDVCKDKLGDEWEVEYADSKDMYDRGKTAFAKGDRSGMLDLLVVQLFERGANRSIVVQREQSDNELLGVQEKSVQEVIENTLQHF